MTLIIRELIIRGEVLDDNSLFVNNESNEDLIKNYLVHLKKEIEEDCYDRILEKLQNQMQR